MPPTDSIQILRDMIRTDQIQYVDGGFKLGDNLTERQMRYIEPWLVGREGANIEEQQELHETAMRVAAQLRAEELITKAWNEQGGPKSSVGVPLTAKLVAEPRGADWAAAFRSGTITVRNHETVTKKTEDLTVEFVGLECNIRQEKRDEVYGVVAVIGPANNQIKTFRFPAGDDTVKMGRDGERIWNAYEPLYRGPIEDIVLVVTLIEHDDFTDIEGTSRRIADTIAEKGGQALGALTGVPAEAVTDQTWFRDTLATGIGFVLGDVFGAGDDPYTPQSLKVPWTEIGKTGPMPQPQRRRDDDPKTIDHWTHRVKVIGHDDAGDIGDYDFYFNFDVVKTEVTQTKRHN